MHQRRKGVLLGLWVVGLLTGCQAEVVQGLQFPGLQGSRSAHEFNDTRFEMESCTIRQDRSAICHLSVDNKYRDKNLIVYGIVTIQDDAGNDYRVTGGGFGEPSDRPKWNQLAVADSKYKLSVIASNLSSQATSIRAVIFQRLQIRSPQGPTLGYRDQVVFSKPTMIAEHGIDGGSGASLWPDADRWVVVGIWNYDPADGQHLPANGYVLRTASGAALGQSWNAHLELKNHGELPPRNRTMWPVTINASLRRVCANYPGYPSYPAFIDMPGDEADGTYQVAECNER